MCTLPEPIQHGNDGIALHDGIGVWQRHPVAFCAATLMGKLSSDRLPSVNALCHTLMPCRFFLVLATAGLLVATLSLLQGGWRIARQPPPRLPLVLPALRSALM